MPRGIVAHWLRPEKRRSNSWSHPEVAGMVLSEEIMMEVLS